jgi:GTPase
MGRIVAIVGRPNVGKSTFFNRLVGQRVSIEDPTSGVTRDRIYGKTDWNGVEFSVIDTGGYVFNSDDFFDTAIRSQVQLAIDEADVILFLMDVTEGITPFDEDVARLLRNSEKPVLAVANKADTNQRYLEATEFYSLGFDMVYPISATNGSGTGDLLDDVVNLFPKEDIEELNEDLPRFCIVGRPNAGKSSLLNALLGTERSIVTPIAGTTRDSINTRYNMFGFDFLLIDTAGMRKKSNVSEDLEFYSYVRAIRSIENSDVCILMIDAERGIESQDLSIFRIIYENNKGVVVLINKWDLVEKETNSAKEFEAHVRERLAPFKDVPVIFTSALTKQRIHKALEVSFEVYKSRSQRITTSKLNEIFLPLIQDNPPPMHKGKRVKVKYITQLPTHYPSFVFFCNMPQYIKDPYKRYIENQIRRLFNFKGVPITLYFRQK